MSITVRLDGNESIQVREFSVEGRPPETIAFDTEGTISLTEDMLAAFAGSTLDPSRIELRTDDDRIVSIDLEDDPSLRLETVDVGIATADGDVPSLDADSIRSTAGTLAEGTDSFDVLSFTVEGDIEGVTEETFEILSTHSAAPEAIEFSVDDAIRSDGGDESDVLLEIALFGFAIVVRRDGVISVETLDAGIDVGVR